MSSIVLASGDNPDDVIVDGDMVFFSNRGDNSVRTVPVSGGTVITLATGQARPVRLAADGTYVYWSSNLGGGILRTLENSSGAPTLLTTATQPWGIVVDSTNVYWVDQGTNSVMVVPKGGGTATKVADLPGSNNGDGVAGDEIVLVGNVLYVGQAGILYQIPPPSGPATQVVSTGYWYVAAGGSYVYELSGGGVQWLDLTTLQTAQNGSFGQRGLGADACGAYTSVGSGTMSLMVHPNDTQYAFFAPITNWTAKGSQLYGEVRIAVDATRVYWTDPGTMPPTSHDGVIYAALKPQ